MPMAGSRIGFQAHERDGMIRRIEEVMKVIPDKLIYHMTIIPFPESIAVLFADSEAAYLTRDT